MSDLQCPHCGEPLPSAFGHKLKRRWGSYGLRTMLLAVTALCLLLGWLSYYTNWTIQRDAILNGHQVSGWSTIPNFRAPLVLGWFGVEYYDEIRLPSDASEDFVDRCRALFPESRITVDSPDSQTFQPFPVVLPEAGPANATDLPETDGPKYPMPTTDAPLWEYEAR